MSEQSSLKNLSELSLDTKTSTEAESLPNQPGIYICIEQFRREEFIPCEIGDLIKVTQTFMDGSAIGLNFTSLETGLVHLDFFIEMAPEMLIDLAKSTSPKKDMKLPFYPVRKESINASSTHCIQTDDLDSSPSLYFIWKWPGTSVVLWGSFNDWARGIPLFYDSTTSAHVAFVETIENQGDHCIFKFYVDGEWKVDPELEQIVDEDEGDIFNTIQVVVYVIEGELVTKEVEYLKEEQVRYVIPARLVQSQVLQDGSSQDDSTVEKLFKNDTAQYFVEKTILSESEDIDVAKFDPSLTKIPLPKSLHISSLDSESEYNQSPVDLIRFDEVLKVKVDSEENVKVRKRVKSLIDSVDLVEDGFIQETDLVNTPKDHSVDDVVSYDEYVREQLNSEFDKEQLEVENSINSPVYEENNDDVITFDDLVQQKLEIDNEGLDKNIVDDGEIGEEVITFEELVQQQIQIDNENMGVSGMLDENGPEEDVIRFDELVHEQMLIDATQRLIPIQTVEDLTSFDSSISRTAGLDIFDKGAINFETLLTDRYMTSTPPRPLLQPEVLKSVLAHEPPVWEEVEVTQQSPRKRFSTFNSLDSEDFYHDIPLTTVNSFSYPVTLAFLVIMLALSTTRVWWQILWFGIDIARAVVWCWVLLGILCVFHLFVHEDE